MEEYDNLYGLAFGCPYIKRTQSCPFNDVIDKSIIEKVDWVDALSILDKQKKCMEHNICSCNRHFKSKV